MRITILFCSFLPVWDRRRSLSRGQVASIIYKNCSACHRPGEAAPFSLLSYRDAATHGQMIVAATSGRIMPPWRAEPASYAYRGERRLSEADIATLSAWVKARMPEGSGKAPEPPQFPSGWQLGEPDLVVEMPEAYHVKADGPDVYRNIPLQPGLTEDKWITAIEMRPDSAGGGAPCSVFRQIRTGACI